MSQTETRWIRDIPSDPMMTNQWSQQPIPWCTTHDQTPCEYTNPAAPAHCPVNCPATRTSGERSCQLSTGGPGHKWWRDQ